MKATSLIATKGLKYAVDLIGSAPSNATQWNEGYEFKCGQNAVTISPEDREKHFVDLVELKLVVSNIYKIDEAGGISLARKIAKDGLCKVDALVAMTKAIADWNEVYIRKGALVDVDFISESRTIYSGKRFSGRGVVDRFDGRNVYGRLNDGMPFMCFPEDVQIRGYEVDKHLLESEKLNRLG